MKILILTSSIGSEHKSTAQKIKEKILRENKNSEIEIVSIFKDLTSKPYEWIKKKTYNLLSNKLINLYNKIYNKNDKINRKNTYNDFGNRIADAILYKLLKKIYEIKPDIIICTNVYSAIAIANLKLAYEIPAKVIAMTLNYGISPYWECAENGIDNLLLTDEYMVKPFIERGYDKKKLEISGIIIGSEYYSPIPQIKARIKTKLDSSTFTLLVNLSNFFPIKVKNLINELEKINEKIQIVFNIDSKSKNKTKVKKLISNKLLKHDYRIIDSEDEVIDYYCSSDLYLGKASGITTTECIALGLPALLINKLPQQEIYNKNYAVANHCANPVTNKTIAKEINFLIAHPYELNLLKDNTKKIFKFKSLDILYNIIKKTPLVEYKNAVLVDSKRTLHKIIKKARLQQLQNINKKNN